MTLRVLLTGFSPFGGAASNSSERVVRKLAERVVPRRGYELVTEILRTEYSSAGRRIQRLIQRTRPAVCICLGMDPGSRVIRVERLAHNLDACAAPDNAGEVRLRRKVVVGGPAVYESTLSPAAICTALVRSGVPVSPSESAGGYVCNHVYYAVLHEIDRRHLPTLCVFLHLPAIRARRRCGLPLRTLADAVEACIGTAVQCARKRESKLQELKNIAAAGSNNSG